MPLIHIEREFGGHKVFTNHCWHRPPWHRKGESSYLCFDKARNLAAIKDAEKGEKRLLRNERARRRHALKHVLKPLPLEVEQIIMKYVHKPWAARTMIDVAMSWQRHPTAALLKEQSNFVPGSMKMMWLKKDYKSYMKEKNYIKAIL